MTRMRNKLTQELAPQVQRLALNANGGLPIGLGTLGKGALNPLEEIASAAGRKAYARRQAAAAEWAASPFYELRHSDVQAKGVIGELLTKSLFEQVFGLQVTDAFTESNGVRRPATKFDEIIAQLGSNDSKLATRGLDGMFSWGAINPQDERYAMLWGVAPDSLRGWLIPTKDLVKLLEAKRQGAAITGISCNKHGVFSIRARVDSAPPWLSPFGGDEAALRARVALELNK